ncbi:hypothetical protein K8Q94_00350 [Candidatus Nomurabacteria bacterium]|nr:hypothetical protein [Candidatus Nomurabacteria bacterium]
MSSHSPDVLHANIEWHIELIAIQISHAKKVKGRARSGYYKMATILGATIVEGLVHAILQNKLGIDGVIFTGKKISYDCCELPKRFSEKEQLAICKRKDEKIELKKNPDFAVLNNTCLKERLFSKEVFNRVEDVRKTRNKIHIQGLDHIDRSYTNNNVEKIAKTVNRLVDLYNRSHNN